MTHIIRSALFLGAVLFTLPALAVEPLPKGAKARLGSPLMRDSSLWNGAVLSPDGKYLIMQAPKGLTKFDVTTGEPAGAIGDKVGGFDRRIELSADGSRAMNINYQTISVWDTASGKSLAELKRTIPYGDFAATLSGNGKVLAAGGNPDFNAKDKPITAIVWDVEKNEKMAEVAVLQNQAVYVALSPDGKLLATYGTHFEKNPPKEGTEPATDPNRIVQIWDAATGKELTKVRSEGYNSARITFSPDGQTLAVSAGNGWIRLIDPKTGADRRRLFGRSDQGFRLAFSPDGKTLASSGVDGVVQLFNIADGTRTALVECPAGALTTGVRGITFTAPDRAVIWTNVGLTAIVWEAPSGKLLSPLAGHVSGVRSVAFAADGKELLTSGDDGLIFRWDPSGKELGEVKIKPSGGYGSLSRYSMALITLTPDGKSATSMNLNGIFELPSGRQIASAQGASETRSLLCRDARTLLLVPYVPYPPKPQPKSLKVPVWDLTTGTKLCEIETPTGEMLQASLTPDRSKLVTVMSTRGENNKSDFHVIGWEVATGKKLGAFTEPGGFGATHLAMSPDNVSVLATTPNGKFLAIDIVEGKMLREIDVNRRGLTGAPVFAPGGKQFALPLSSGFGNNTVGEIRLFDWDSGKATGVFSGHAGAIMSLAYSPDGKTILSGAYDTTALLWDVAAASPPGE